MRSAMKGIPLLGFACLFLATIVPAFSPTTTGRIVGKVHDQSDAVLAGATVTVTDVQRATRRAVTTDESGAYVFVSLTPSVYVVRAEANGFKTVERPGVEVEVATDVTVNLALPPGDVKETVVVSAEVPLVNATSSTLGGTLSNKEIN